MSRDLKARRAVLSTQESKVLMTRTKRRTRSLMTYTIEVGFREKASGTSMTREKRTVRETTEIKREESLNEETLTEEILTT